MPPTLDPSILREPALVDRFRFLYRECTPRILVVADGGLDFGAGGFGLQDFIDTLKASSIHGMTPVVKTAHRGASAADYTNFTFSSSTLSKSSYDVLFLFGIATSPELPAAEVDVISRFMEDGGGVFATGDHDELGKALCNRIPRVRAMRYWSAPDVPSASGTDRLSTNLPGADNTYQFDDQSDGIPQRIYPRYGAPPGGTPSDSRPHALLQHPSKKVIEVLPDHPHEGECVVPSSLATSFTLGGSSRPEWPQDGDGNTVAPELVALSMSYGGGFGSKQPLVPRAFGAIGAYDGHRADVGRVCVDATWHHFININLTGAGSTGPGLAANPDALDRVHTYYENIADWLMPKRVRRCLRWPLLRVVAELYPLPEILPLPPDPLGDLDAALRLGAEVEGVLSKLMTEAAIEELKDDLLETHSPKLTRFFDRPLPPGSPAARALARQLAPRAWLARAALGVAVATLVRELPPGEDLPASLEKAGGIDGLEASVKKQLAPALGNMGGLLRESLDEIEQLARQL